MLVDGEALWSAGVELQTDICDLKGLALEKQQQCYGHYSYYGQVPQNSVTL